MVHSMDNEGKGSGIGSGVGGVWGCVWGYYWGLWWIHIDSLAQDCSNSIASAMELLQSCTKPSIYRLVNWVIIILGNELSPFQNQAITCNNAVLLSLDLRKKHLNGIFIVIQKNSIKMPFKMFRPQCINSTKTLKHNHMPWKHGY